MILTEAEIAALDQGRKQEQHIKAFTRIITMRSTQAIKDKTIYDFAYDWINQLRRSEITAADKRHARALVEVLKEEGLL